MGHQPDVQGGAPAAVVCASDRYDADRWCASLRRGVYGAVLYHVVLVATPVLLSVRFLGFGATHLNRDLCRNLDRAHILSAHIRGLPLVVARISVKRSIFLLRLLLFHHLL